MSPAPAWADYDPPSSIGQEAGHTPVEIVSGWYLRGDVAYVPKRDITDIFVPGAGIHQEEEQHQVFASAGVGYRFNDFLRGELNIGYLPGDKTTLSRSVGADTYSLIMKNRAWTGMINGYVDLGTYAGITPYLGAGIGLYRNKYSLGSYYSGAASSVSLVQKHTQTTLAYTLNAGAAYQLSENLQVDLGYQYLSAPQAAYSEMKDLAKNPTYKGLEYHQLKVGLRYNLR
jgi:opacity protein-like surface antigen